MMLRCWAETPEKRPEFKILQRDLDDFENAGHKKYKNYDKYLTAYGKCNSVESEATPDIFQDVADDYEKI